jgi:hypothetical protein
MWSRSARRNRRPGLKPVASPAFFSAPAFGPEEGILSNISGPAEKNRLFFGSPLDNEHDLVYKFYLSYSSYRRTVYRGADPPLVECDPVLREQQIDLEEV